MQITKYKPKITATIVIILMMASAIPMIMPVNAQYGYGNWSNPMNPRPNGSIPLPAGVTPDVTLKTSVCLSFRPNPVGVGQPILVNMWMDPPVAVTRYLSDFKVTITKPDGSKDVKTMNSYQADSTAWFEYTPDQVGTWKLKFEFPGGYFPSGNYTMPAGISQAGFTESYTKSCYYMPSSTAEQTLIVQKDMVSSWPPLPLPTDYWTRPIPYENREWASIAGDYPWNGPGGGANWPAKTNEYWNGRLNFIPYVQAPNNAHIAWKRVGAMSGIIGGTAGLESTTTGGGNPSLIYMGRAYQTITKAMPTMVNGTVRTLPVSVWQCYDLRTGEVYWELTDVTAPTNIEYDYGSVEVPGATGRAGTSVSLVAISGGRLIKYAPLTGAVNLNVSISPLTTSTYYQNGWALGVQVINTTC